MRYALLALLLFTAAVSAAPEFPRLSGRVVDAAGMLSRQTVSQVSASLEAHEQATTNQVVVVTVPDLGGYAIEEYGYQLGRHWGIGQKGKDNGAMLIVAKDEREVRIEVGYGLEGQLTDAIASNIINQVITPRFKRADFDGGVTTGVQAMVRAIGGEYQIKQTRDKSTNARVWIVMIVLYLIWMSSPALGALGVWPFTVIMMLNRGGRGGFGGSGRRSGGFSGGGGGSGGFRGGGGSFGGGGASGRW